MQFPFGIRTGVDLPSHFPEGARGPLVADRLPLLSNDCDRVQGEREYGPPLAVGSPRGHQAHYTGQEHPVGGLAGDLVAAGLVRHLRRHHELASEELAEDLPGERRLPPDEAVPVGEATADLAPELAIVPARRRARQPVQVLELGLDLGG